ncbi:MAG: AraC family transcriptional regulator [Conexibacteraceae bacterium]|nr:AraC family transcriptional regulator [Conexibacteraceae bacterium]
MLPVDAVELVQRIYDPDAGREEHYNSSGCFVIVLPYTAGSIRLERDGVIVHDGAVHPGTVRLAPPGEHSAIQAWEPFESAMLWIPSSTIATAAGGLGAWPRDEAVLAARRDVRQLCPALISAFGLRGQRRDLVVGGLANALLGLVLGHRSTASRGLDDDHYTAAVTFAQQHLQSGLTLDDWASAVDMTGANFSRHFRDRAGVAPYAWFMDRRIDEAMRLLATTDQPIVEIAFEIGFDSQSHFTDAFKRRAGMPPGQWREARRATNGAVRH